MDRHNNAQTIKSSYRVNAHWSRESLKVTSEAYLKYQLIKSNTKRYRNSISSKYKQERYIVIDLLVIHRVDSLQTNDFSLFLAAQI